MKKKNTIHFNYHDVSIRIKKATVLKEFLTTVMVQEKTPFSRIDYIFCTDSFLVTLNQEYLSHDTYTDILTFTLSSPEEPLVSEIYISIDRVRENADQLNLPFENELNRVMIHGLLHLCGYNDHTKKEKEEMRQKENFHLSRL